MAQPSQRKSPVRPVSARSHQRSLLAMEETMREEIRELQEQRAAAMMTEIVELEKERDLALGKVKRLEKKVKDVEAEAMQLRKNSSSTAGKAVEGKGDLVALLRQTLLEEQLLTSDLKRKLQSTKKQNLALSQQLQEAKNQPGSPDPLPRRRRSFDSRTASPLASPALTLQSDRTTPASHRKPPTPHTHTPATPTIDISVAATTLPTSSGGGVGGVATASPLSRRAAGYSPTVIPRRYKLAAAISREVSTQTEDLSNPCSSSSSSSPPSHSSQPSENTPTSTLSEPPDSTATQTSQSDQPPTTDLLAPPILETLSSARADIVRLQGERDEAKRELAKEVDRRAAIRKDSESLQLECGVLRDALSQFSRWVRGKLGNMEENMDIFRVIYSLHGSLSQEQSVLQELQDKLHQAERKVLQLELSNRHLTLAASEAEEKYQQTLSHTKTRQDTLSPLPPSSSSFLSPPSSSTAHVAHLRSRQFSSPQLPLRHHIPASPLTTHTPSHPHHNNNTSDVI